jgi:apolipoprotein N-acyltransferase
VPFGEFIPLWSIVSGANIAPLQQIGAGFTPGAPPLRLIVPEAPAAVVLICYEAIFPDLTPRGDDRPGWIVSITNDAWFGRATGPWQHYNMARYRAIEEGLPLARAASGGVSAIVDAYGRPVAETGMEGGAAEAQLPAELPPTIYSKLGNLLTTLVFFAVLVLSWAPTPKGAGGAENDR